MSYNEFVRKIIAFSSIILLSSCSLFGIQSEEGPKYKVLVKQGDFEIRQYSSYIVAKTTVKGNYSDSSSEAFRILAGYIFGKNKEKNKIAMTSPVEMEQKSLQIAMTSPVEMNQSEDQFTMKFSMPSQYSMEDLPEPLDKRIEFEKVEEKIIASHQFSWFSSESRVKSKADELYKWINQNKNYNAEKNHTYAGYNPPWTIPFLRRNEVHIELIKNGE